MEILVNNELPINSEKVKREQLCDNITCYYSILYLLYYIFIMASMAAFLAFICKACPQPHCLRIIQDKEISCVQFAVNTLPLRKNEHNIILLSCSVHDLQRIQCQSSILLEKQFWLNLDLWHVFCLSKRMYWCVLKLLLRTSFPHSLLTWYCVLQTINQW